MSNSSAAQRTVPTDELSSSAVGVEHLAPASADASELPPFALKQQVAERLAAHRARRGRPAESTAAEPVATPRHSRSAHIAAAVAERYAQSPSYRTFLAAEAERSVRQAEAAADVALINAKAIAAAQQQMLSDLEHWDPDPEDFALGPVPVPTPARPKSVAAFNTPLPDTDDADANAWQEASTAQLNPPVEASRTSRPLPSFTVRHFEDAAPSAPSLPERLVVSPTAPDPDTFDDHEGLLLDEEIAFRHDPIFEEPAGDPLPITANLLEFPRQLIASRKARPRLAEGPLRDEYNTNGGGDGQLRIFEVETAYTRDDSAVDALTPEWTSILLGAHTHTEADPSSVPAFVPGNHPQPAPVSLRLMATLVDGAILLGTLAAFSGVFALTVTRFSGSTAAIRIPLLTAASAIAAALFVFAVIYYLLFIALSEATPGMRYARIAFCTLSDENPTRSAMCRRLLCTLLALVPLGLGIFWVFLDEDTLGWHDRLSRMYQRSY